MDIHRERKTRTIFAIFNFIFLIGGIIFIGLGAGVLVAYQNYDQILSDKFYSIPTFMIVCGSIAFFVGFLGCCGAFQRNFCMIISFVVLLIVLFIFELSAGIAAYVLRDDIEYIIKSEMKKSIGLYIDNVRGATKFWDFIQYEYNCCGVTGYDDWLSAIGQDMDLPLSCCDTTGFIGDVHCRVTDEEILRPEGCAVHFGDFLEGHAGTIGAISITLAMLQLAAVVFASFVARNIRRSKY